MNQQKNINIPQQKPFHKCFNYDMTVTDCTIMYAVNKNHIN